MESHLKVILADSTRYSIKIQDVKDICSGIIGNQPPKRQQIEQYPTNFSNLRFKIQNLIYRILSIKIKI